MEVLNVKSTAQKWPVLGIAAVSPDNSVRILCGLVTCDLHHPAFLGTTSRSNNTAELTGLAEAVRWIEFSIPRGERVRILHDSKHAARVTLGVAHAQRNIALAQKYNELVLRSKGMRISSHHVFSHAVNTGNECVVIAASLPGHEGFHL